MRYVIEFSSGKYLKSPEDREPVPLKDAMRFASSEKANDVLRANKWIQLSGGMVDVAEVRSDDDSIQCPLCGHLNHDLCEIDFGGAEGTTETDCGECGETFSLSRRVHYTYIAREKEGGARG